ncbi:flippase-like domain-containing protein [Geomonas sp. RF6]|uniref:lysylphosphatidylglycerol synthase transmembrane domain-containing protein n=1 Tax=Geomonas sp. RF6 TaxID=2897342 RepID=UPI001E33E6A0|nr:lysylphosphatidylglycerol synthase transmembrane domain-containing protein [Geomonas sp. RF6]UFS69703.1 flippase-like domain-containing protein [Geomonas sp. RF6]
MKHVFDKKLWLGIAISGFFLFLLGRQIEPGKLVAAFRQMDYRFLLPALLLTMVSYFFRALRWKYLLLPIKKTRLSNLFPSTLIGYMANNLLPARLGEFVRAYSLAQKEELKTSAVFGTLVVDRLWDGFTMLLVLLVTFFTVRLPAGKEHMQEGLATGGYITLAVYLTALAILAVLKKKPALAVRTLSAIPPAKLGKKLAHLAESFIQGLQLSTSPREIATIFALSLLVWGTAIWPLDFLLASFDLHFPLTVSMFIMVFLVFAVMVPSSPGFVGTYHYACVSALAAFDVAPERALSVAIVMHGMGFFPVTVIGLFCLWRDKLSLKKLSAAEDAEHETGASA